MSSIHSTYTKRCRPIDPINIVFQDIEIGAIEHFLNNNMWEKDNTRWLSDQYIPTVTPRKKRLQDLMLKNGRYSGRYHLRLWSEKDQVIGSTHIDMTRVLFFHDVADFDLAKKYLAHQCTLNASWHVIEDAIDYENSFFGHRKASHNGKATLVKPK